MACPPPPTHPFLPLPSFAAERRVFSAVGHGPCTHPHPPILGGTGAQVGEQLWADEGRATQSSSSVSQKVATREHIQLLVQLCGAHLHTGSRSPSPQTKCYTSKFSIKKLIRYC